MPRAQQTTYIKTPHGRIRKGAIVRVYWGGQVEGQKPRTTLIRVHKIMDDGRIQGRRCNDAGIVWDDRNVNSTVQKIQSIEDYNI